MAVLRANPFASKFAIIAIFALPVKPRASILRRRLLPQLVQNKAELDLDSVPSDGHVLCILPSAEFAVDAKRYPLAETLATRLRRRNAEHKDLADKPLSAELASGAQVVWVVIDVNLAPIDQLSRLRDAVRILLDERPLHLDIAIYGRDSERRIYAELAVYVTAVNAVDLPTFKKREARHPLASVAIHGYVDDTGFAATLARAEGNLLARSLTVLPPNELTPTRYREQIRLLAQDHGWQIEEFDYATLREMGAGAFCAVAQGSAQEDAAIVRLRYGVGMNNKSVALVGKGICFDTGGHNLKPSRHMLGMNEDMNGSAVALGILLAASKTGLALQIDVWLAIAQNHIGPNAYKQNDVVTALDGTTIEIVHTDAEGRMVLADTLTLASREQPELIISFATLTGSMITALGSRYSGVLGNDAALLERAIAAGRASGERVCAFPADADYDSALDSKVADVKQCTLDGEADHILAVRFLSRFVGAARWLHMDLSAANCKGGLGAVATDVTGFGVGLGYELLRRS